MADDGITARTRIAHEALNVVIQVCHRLVLNSRPHVPVVHTYCHRRSRLSKYDQMYACMHATYVLQKITRQRATPTSAHRRYDFNSMAYATTRTDCKFITWCESGADRDTSIGSSDTDTDDDETERAHAELMLRSVEFFREAVYLTLHTPETLENLHVLHLINMPVEDPNITRVTTKLQNCRYLNELVLDGVRTISTSANGPPVTASATIEMASLRTFVARCCGPSVWPMISTYARASALHTLHLQEVHVFWCAGWEFAASLRVVRLVRLTSSDVDLFLAVKRLPKLADCSIINCLDALPASDLFDRFLPAWNRTSHATLTVLRVDVYVSWARNPTLRAFIQEHDPCMYRLWSRFYHAFRSNVGSLHMRLCTDIYTIRTTNSEFGYAQNLNDVMADLASGARCCDAIGLTKKRKMG
ncbi:hypothetical protein CYMTET_40202 [Cymbomonas tetramitiformis]|uniref:Uncharacterized protein n=1 Tax=Cymbomonas tetramitiformis TaxID=36881 RepID=A0AAE0C9L5_9CHLO|nr:hypothetical protein CYMTET_40202 [Cymbomonas tetramitiformis]